MHASQFFLAGFINAFFGIENIVLQSGYLLQAAKLGKARAQYWVGSIYLNGWGVASNSEEAFKWLLQAAQQSDVDACYQVGLLYGSGNGVKKDSVQSYAWIYLAATAGNDNAQEEERRLAKTLTEDELKKGQQSSRNLIK